MDTSIISPDPATKEEVTPQYDSSEEWEIGLGNLIIDLDADLEKDRQDVPSADSSPMRIGKMKIKRKVSSSKGDTAAASPRKDQAANNIDESTLPTATTTVPAHQASPERPVLKQDVVAKSRMVVQHKKDLNLKQDKTFINPTGNNASKGPVIVSLTSATTPTTLNTPNPTVLLNTSIASSTSATPLPPPLQQQPKHAENQNHSIAHSVAIAGSPMKMLTINAVKLPEIKDSDKKPSKMESRGAEEEVKVKEEVNVVVNKKKEEKEVKVETNSKKEGSHSGGAKKHGGKKGKNEKATTHSVAVDTCDMSTLTDPDCLGPCEPGTSVNLEGIVWHETDQGVLVVNVTWRNKTYVGTLLDCTKHDWAPPRFCDSPTSDMENRNAKTPGRPKRGRSSSSTTNSDLSNFTETRSSIHSKLRNSTTIKGRRGSGASNGSRTPPNAIDRNQGKRKIRPTDIDLSSGEDSNKAAKRMKTARNTPTPNSSEGATSPVFIECPEPNCNKKYKHINGLRYHQTHAHQDNPRPEAITPDESDNPESTKAVTDEVPDLNLSKEEKTQMASELPQGALPSTPCPPKVAASTADKSKDTKTSPSTSTTPTEKREESLPPCSPTGSTSTDSSCKDSITKDSTVKGKVDVARSPKGGQHKIPAEKSSPSKLLHGVSKSKDSVSAVKTKTDSHSNDKSNNKHKKAVTSLAATSNQKDMSVFDFNSTAEADDHSKKMNANIAEKPTGVSVIRSNPEQITIKTEPLSPPAVGVPKTPDMLKMPTTPQHSDDAQKHSKSKEKEKAKGGSEKKKSKQDKTVQKPKSARPIAPAPPHPQPPQLIAIPAIVATSSTTTPTPLTIPSVTTKPTGSSPSTGPALKPIQPKPSVADNSTVNTSIANLKDKKSKPKKKSKTDKEKHTSGTTPKEGTKVDSKDNVKPKEAKPKDSPPTSRPDQLTEASIAAALLENNILKQALTASGIGPEDAGRNSPYVAGSSSDNQAKGTDQPPKETPKELHSLIPSRLMANPTMPEMPKLIPTSSILNSANRPPHHGPMQPQQQQQPPPPPPTKPIIPSSPEAMKTEFQGLPPTTQTKSNTLPSEHPVPTLTVPQSTEDGRAGSPAYSDISDANDDPPIVAAKPREDRDPYAFHDTPISRAQQANKPVPEDLRRVEREQLAVPMFSPLTEVARERGVSNESLAKSLDTMRSTPTQSIKLETTREPIKEGPEAKKARKDTQSPSTDSTYRPQAQPGTVFGGQYSFVPGYVAMDPSYHQRLISTDPHYRQQHEQFIGEQRKRAEAERIEREKREQETSKDKPAESLEPRPIPKIKTEPVTPTKRDPICESKGMRPEKDHHHLKRKGEVSAEAIRGKQLDFNKPGSESPDLNATNGASKSTEGRTLQEQQREEMRLYSLYDTKQRELQRQEEEQRKVKEQEGRHRSESSESRKENRRTPDREHSRRASVSPRRDASKEQGSSATSSKVPTDEKKHRESPLGKSQSPHDKSRGPGPPSRRVLETYPAYLHQQGYVHTAFGPMPFDPNHPAYQAVNPMVAYPTYIPHELHYPPPAGPRVISPIWKSSEERGRYELERESRPTSPPSSSGSKSRDSSRERPTKALDVLQQHANQYFSSHKNERPTRSPEPERERRPSTSPHRAASPAGRKTPATPTTRAESPRYDATRRHGPPFPPGHLLHQHMHTHQHTHLGMGYPVLQPYDHYVLASHQQAAAAAAASGVNPYAVRRE
ncbi:zinc finger protein 608-like isoform X1 [Asterias rubens]|uniref:zinc finger protein 608-like isoform X1 n=2 Tax=Asterias rubens TaxID=7604 RepID=UPI0014559EC8|nr:zinc finger protein 608-like isoform X1 [Asterias rubens]XP_033633854.1 zinc finger protein 608-like isoform X1 [Asterias rubens]